MKKHWAIIVITLVGGVLRFNELGLKPLWVDEALFGLWVRENDLVMQEFVPVLIGKLLGLHTEFGLRSLSAFFGTLTIPAIYLVLKKWKLTAAVMAAIFPLFVFWSRMARPYAVAGFFVVLGWRWWAFYIPALFTTTISFVGVKLLKQKKYVLLLCIAIGVITFIIRPDAGRFTNSDDFLKMLEYSTRWFYLCCLAILLYWFDVVMPYLERKGFESKK